MRLANALYPLCVTQLCSPEAVDNGLLKGLERKVAIPEVLTPSGCAGSLL